MAIQKDIAEERIRIGKAVQKSKFAKGIAERILDPLLENLEDEMADTADWIGQFIVAHIRERIMGSTPSGREYKVILVDPSEGFAEDAYTEIGEYTASAEGDPPASFSSSLGVPTGTLLESISYEISDDGRVRVGVFHSAGSEYTSLFFRGGKIFVTEGDEGSRTSVEEYANFLDTGWSNKYGSSGPHPWFRDVMEELRPQIRKMIREKLNKALKRNTKSKGGRSIYFRVYFENKNELASTSSTDHVDWRDEI
jgi:hypothetical protein